jgi:hypothetical protein
VVLLFDGAGEVAATSDGVTQVEIGGRIAGCFCWGISWGRLKQRTNRAFTGLQDRLTNRPGDPSGSTVMSFPYPSFLGVFPQSGGLFVARHPLDR